MGWVHRTSRSRLRASAGPGPSATSTEGTHNLAGFEVLAREIPHPGGRAFGYRVSDGRTSMAYLSDHGPIALGPGPEGWGPYHDAALALADGVDVLLHDAQYTAEELPARATFGHSAAGYAVQLAERAGARRAGPVPPRSLAHRRRGRGAGRAAPARGGAPYRARDRGRHDPALIGSGGPDSMMVRSIGQIRLP